MTYAPLIAVAAARLEPGRVTRWPDGGYGVPAPYLSALRIAGCRVAILAPGETVDATDLLEPFDGLLLVGGGDVDPGRYDAEPGPHDYGIDPERDAFEIALLHAADRRQMPVLCLCRGMQVMNVAFGGSLHAHLPDHADLLPHGTPADDTKSMHEVEPVPGSRLAATTKSGPLACSSHHHQGVDRVGDGLAVSGRSPDGLVEAIELIVEDQQDETATWMLGVQWHPEETAATDPAQQSLFDALSLIARLRGSIARPGETRGRTRAYALSDPDPSWPARFEREAAELRALLGDVVVRIDHVGSTSVPGLVAKPIVDIQLSVRSMVPRSAYVDPLVAAGYRWVVDPWSDQHEYFSFPVDAERRIHLHVCQADSDWERRHVAFRDWLRAHPEDAAAYAALKTELAAAHPNDVFSYTDRKGPFIRSIEAKALTED
jgi:putative glutamine amidotransferase